MTEGQDLNVIMY